MPITILIVDDERMVRNALKRTLHGEGYEILEAGNGQEALQLIEARYAQGQTVQLVLSDRDMPEMGGEELLREIEKLYPEIIRILVSGNVEAVRRVLDEHVAHHAVSKPWKNGDLRARVRTATGEQPIVTGGNGN